MFLGGAVRNSNYDSLKNSVINDSMEFELDEGGYLIFQWSSPKSINDYIPPISGEIPIMVTSPAPYDRLPQASDIEGILECNANVVIDHPTHIDALMESVKRTRMKVIMSWGVMDPDVFLRIVRDYHTNRNIGGWLISSDPYIYNWVDKDLADKVTGCNVSNLPTGYSSNLRALLSDIRIIDPNHMAYFNLPATTNPCYIGNYPSYESYLENFQKALFPPVWSYNLYPIHASNGKTTVDYVNFYKYLKTFSDFCKKTGRPFWHYCQSVSYKLNGSLYLPTPTEAMLRYEAFTALAFGAKGIAYWYYAQRADNATEEYITSPVTKDGTRTPVWYAMQKVNSEIRRYSRVFLNTECVRVVEFGVPSDNLEQITNLPYGPILQIHKIGERGLLISHLKDGYWNYFVVVNKSVESNTTFTIAFNPSKYVTHEGDGGLISSKEMPTTTGNASKETQWVMGPGGYVIFSWYDPTED